MQSKAENVPLVFCLEHRGANDADVGNDAECMDEVSICVIM